MKTGLARYDATRQALIECASLDEAKEIRDKAQALVAYAKLSKDNELEKRSVEIRERAKIKLGEMSLALPKKQGKRDDLQDSTSPQIEGEVKPKAKALAAAGVSTQEASRAEKLAKKSEEAQEAHITKAVEAVEKRNNPTSHVAHNSGENEWYTPPIYLEAARRAMGNIDLDPASCLAANSIVKAAEYFTTEDDGLKQKWSGNVWMNPPYSQPLVGQFIDKLLEQIDAENTQQACILVNNFTDTQAGQKLIGSANAVCFVAKRIRFIDKDGNESGAPLQGQMIRYFGAYVDGFGEEFSPFGTVLFKGWGYD